MPAVIRTGVIAALTLTLLTSTFAQSTPPKKKKIKDFGSSLKRLKWDPVKNAAEGQYEEVGDGDVIRIDTSLVSCEMLVLDKSGKAVSGLTAEDFSVAEDGTPQKVEHFFLGNNAKVSRTIVLIIDYSGSQLPYLQNSIAAAKVLVDKLGPRDQMAIVTDDVELLLDFTDDKKKLKKNLESLLERVKVKRKFFGRESTRIGRSLQYSALMATLNEMFDEEDIRPIIIFQTDGDEVLYLRNSAVTMSVPDGLEGDALVEAQNWYSHYQSQLLEKKTEFSLDDVYRAVERSRATIYTVVPGPKLTGLPIEEQAKKHRADRQASQVNILARLPSGSRDKIKARMNEREKTLTEAYDRWRAELTAKMQSALSGVATGTGGWTEFLEKPEQAEEIYARIFSDINQRYIVGYYPSNKERDGKRRKIDFEVKGHPEYQIYGRRSYFAPKP